MKQLVPALFGVGAVMALTGAAVFITGWIYAPYIYTIRKPTAHGKQKN